LLPLLSPLLALVSLYLLKPPAPPGTFSIDWFTSSYDFRILSAFWDIGRSWPIFGQMADQIFPVIPLGTWVSVSLVMFGFVVVPAGAAFVAWMYPQRRASLLICIGYVLLYCMFIAIVPAVFHTDYDFRFLPQIYPFMLIGGAIGADLLLNQQQLYSRTLCFIIIALLSIAAARSLRAASLGILGSLGIGGHGAQEYAKCLSSIAILDRLKHTSATQTSSAVLTNVQGLAWYARRAPAVALTSSAIARAPSGTIIIFARPEYTCPFVVDWTSQDISEATLTRRPDVSMISSNGVLLIGAKN
jgi:hypothetical protein